MLAGDCARVSKTVEPRRRRKRADRERNERGVALGHLDGKPNYQIAHEVGITEQQVSEILNSEDVQAIIAREEEIRYKEGRTIFRGMVSDAVRRMRLFMQGARPDHSQQLKATIAILDRAGFGKMETMQIRNVSEVPSLELASDALPEIVKAYGGKGPLIAAIKALGDEE